MFRLRWICPLELLTIQCAVRGRLGKNTADAVPLYHNAVRPREHHTSPMVEGSREDSLIQQPVNRTWQWIVKKYSELQGKLFLASNAPAGNIDIIDLTSSSAI